MQITEIAAQILARAESRAETAAQNIANSSTSGYRRRISFSEFVNPDSSQISDVRMSAASDFSSGRLTETGNPTDLAISGEGFFVVRSDEAILYTRQGQFRRDSEGRLVTGQGLVLQSSEGGDVVVEGDSFQVAADGTVTRDGAPIARIGLVDFDDRQVLQMEEGGAFAAAGAEPHPLEAPVVRQGMLETSNVNMGDEMVAMMEALRRAETGQRLVTTYDDLMARVLNSFGQQ